MKERKTRDVRNISQKGRQEKQKSSSNSKRNKTLDSIRQQQETEHKSQMSFFDCLFGFGVLC